jgi:hypothetical protein
MQKFDISSIKNGLKEGKKLSPLHFNFALEYAIRRVQVNQVGLKLNVTHHFIVYADVNILGRSVYTTTKNTDCLIVASKDIRIEVNADKTK